MRSGGWTHPKKSVELAERKLDRVFLCDVSDLDNLPIKGEKFDVIVYADVLEHLDEPEKVCERII